MYGPCFVFVSVLLFSIVNLVFSDLNYESQQIKKAGCFPLRQVSANFLVNFAVNEEFGFTNFSVKNSYLAKNQITETWCGNASRSFYLDNCSVSTTDTIEISSKINDYTEMQLVLFVSTYYPEFYFPEFYFHFGTRSTEKIEEGPAGCFLKNTVYYSNDPEFVICTAEKVQLDELIWNAISGTYRSVSTYYGLVISAISGTFRVFTGSYGSIINVPSTLYPSYLQVPIYLRESSIFTPSFMSRLQPLPSNWIWHVPFIYWQHQISRTCPRSCVIKSIFDPSSVWDGFFTVYWGMIWYPLYYSIKWPITTIIITITWITGWTPDQEQTILAPQMSGGRKKWSNVQKYICRNYRFLNRTETGLMQEAHQLGVYCVSSVYCKMAKLIPSSVVHFYRAWGSPGNSFTYLAWSYELFLLLFITVISWDFKFQLIPFLVIGLDPILIRNYMIALSGANVLMMICAQQYQLELIIWIFLMLHAHVGSRPVIYMGLMTLFYYTQGVLATPDSDASKAIGRWTNMTAVNTVILTGTFVSAQDWTRFSNRISDFFQTLDVKQLTAIQWAAIKEGTSSLYYNGVSVPTAGVNTVLLNAAKEVTRTAYSTMTECKRLLDEARLQGGGDGIREATEAVSAASDTIVNTGADIAQSESAIEQLTILIESNKRKLSLRTQDEGTETAAELAENEQALEEQETLLSELQKRFEEENADLEHLQRQRDDLQATSTSQVSTAVKLAQKNWNKSVLDHAHAVKRENALTPGSTGGVQTSGMMEVSAQICQSMLSTILLWISTDYLTDINYNRKASQYVGRPNALLSSLLKYMNTNLSPATNATAAAEIKRQLTDPIFSDTQDSKGVVVTGLQNFKLFINAQGERFEQIWPGSTLNDGDDVSTVSANEKDAVGKLIQAVQLWLRENPSDALRRATEYITTRGATFVTFYQLESYIMDLVQRERDLDVVASQGKISNSLLGKGTPKPSKQPTTSPSTGFTGLAGGHSQIPSGAPGMSPQTQAPPTTAPSKTSSNTNGNRQRNCYTCGEAGHLARDCPSSNQKKTGTNTGGSSTNAGGTSTNTGGSSAPKKGSKKWTSCRNCLKEGHMQDSCPLDGFIVTRCRKCSRHGHLDTACFTQGKIMLTDKIAMNTWVRDYNAAVGKFNNGNHFHEEYTKLYGTGPLPQYWDDTGNVACSVGRSVTQPSAIASLLARTVARVPVIANTVCMAGVNLIRGDVINPAGVDTRTQMLGNLASVVDDTSRQSAAISKVENSSTAAWVGEHGQMMSSTVKLPSQRKTKKKTAAPAASPATERDDGSQVKAEKGDDQSDNIVASLYTIVSSSVNVATLALVFLCCLFLKSKWVYCLPFLVAGLVYKSFHSSWISRKLRGNWNFILLTICVFLGLGALGLSTLPCVHVAMPVALPIAYGTSAFWYVDSGCSLSLSNNPKHFINLTTLPTPYHVSTANEGSALQVDGIGDLVATVTNVSGISFQIIIPKAMLCLNAEVPLISTQDLCNIGFDVSFTKRTSSLNPAGQQACIIVDVENRGYGKVVGFVGDPNKGELPIYKLNVEIGQHCANGPTVFQRAPLTPKEIMHKRCAHTHDRLLVKVKSTTDGVPKISGRQIDCDSCRRAKSRSQPYPPTVTDTTGPHQGLSVDLVGKIRVRGRSGAYYYLVMIDDYSHEVTVHTIRRKSMATEIIQAHLTRLNTQHGHYIKWLRSDCGGEFVNKVMIQYLKEHGIDQHLTHPYSPASNGRCERVNGTITQMARALMLDAQLAKSFWEEAVQFATYIYNRLPNNNCHGDTPYQVSTGKRADISHIRVFGCVIYPHIDEENQGDKFDRRADRCIYLGPDLERDGGGHRYYNPLTKKTSTCRSASFVENELGVDHVTERQRTDVTDRASNAVDDFLIAEHEGMLTRAGARRKADEDRQMAADQSGSPLSEVEVPDLEIDDDDVIDEDANDDVNDDDTPSVIHFVSSVPFVSGEDDDQLSKNARMGEFDSTFDHTQHVSTRDLLDDPVPVNKAMKKDNWERVHWIEAERVEVESLKDAKINKGEPVPREPWMQVLNAMFILKRKLNECGSILKYKARYVILGNNQEPNIHYDPDTLYAPVVSLTSLRTMLAVTASIPNITYSHLDIVTAFLYGDLDEELYIYPPPQWGAPQGHVIKLAKAVYGLKQAPKCFNKVINTFLLEYGFTRFESDPCIYKKTQGERVLYLCLYVDDIILASNWPEELIKFKSDIQKKFKIQDNGSLHFALGMGVRADAQGVFLNQTAYLKKQLAKFNINPAYPVTTPMAGELVEKQPGESSPDVPYRAAVGALIYLASGTRLDIAFAVHKVARYSHAFTNEHWEAVLRIFEYLHSTSDYGIQFSSTSGPVLGYADSDYAGDIDTRRSTSGIIFTLGGAPVYWCSRRQPTVSLSSAQAELVSLSQACKEVVWFRCLLAEFGLDMDRPTVVYEDNASTRFIALNDNMGSDIKHIATKHFYVRECIEMGHVVVESVRSSEQPADILTKPLGRLLFTGLRDRLMKSREFAPP